MNVVFIICIVLFAVLWVASAYFAYECYMFLSNRYRMYQLLGEPLGVDIEN